VERSEKGKNGEKKKRTCENGSKKSTSKSAGKRAESTGDFISRKNIFQVRVCAILKKLKMYFCVEIPNVSE
jgi:hypothetical protein